MVLFVGIRFLFHAFKPKTQCIGLKKKKKKLGFFPTFSMCCSARRSAAPTLNAVFGVRNRDCVAQLLIVRRGIVSPTRRAASHYGRRRSRGRRFPPIVLQETKNSAS